MKIHDLNSLYLSTSCLGVFNSGSSYFPDIEKKGFDSLPFGEVYPF